MWRWRDGVANADIDLDLQPGRPESRLERNAPPAIRILFTNRPHLNGLGQKGYRVGLDLDATNLMDDSAQRVVRQLTETQQVRITRRAQRFAEPHEEQQRALQHETLRIRRACESIKKALHCVAREHEVRIDADRFRMSRESHLYRMRKARTLGIHAVSASR